MFQTGTIEVEDVQNKGANISKTECLKGFGRHLLKYKSPYGFLLTLVLLFFGCDIKDIIEVIRLFDPSVGKKVYEILVVLINKTDDHNT